MCPPDSQATPMVTRIPPFITCEWPWVCTAAVGINVGTDAVGVGGAAATSAYRTVPATGLHVRLTRVRLTASAARASGRLVVVLREVLVLGRFAGECDAD